MTRILPAEVVERLTWMFCRHLTDEGKWVMTLLDPTRVIFAKKTDQAKCETWIDALRSRIAIYENKKNGWRKCHTESYWVYYADQLAEEKEVLWKNP